MSIKTVLAGTAAAIILATGAFAQTAPPPAPTAPKTTAPVPAPAAPAPKAQAPAPAAQQAQRVNLNTATEAELDGLPQIGAARAKAIIEARTKGGRFKDWNDFVARNVVPKNAEDAIKEKVRF